MATSRSLVFCFLFTLGLLNSVLSRPGHFGIFEDNEEENDVNLLDAPEEYPEGELIAEKEVANDAEEENDLEVGDKTSDEEKDVDGDEELEEKEDVEKDSEDKAIIEEETSILEKELEEEMKEEEEILEKDLEEEVKNEEEIAEKDLDEEVKDEEEIAEKDLEEGKLEDEIAEKDINSDDEGSLINEGGIIFPDTDAKEEIPDEESFNKDEEVMDSEEGGEPSGFDEEEMEKPSFVSHIYRKIKDFFKGVGK